MKVTWIVIGCIILIAIFFPNVITTTIDFLKSTANELEKEVMTSTIDPASEGTGSSNSYYPNPSSSGGLSTTIDSSKGSYISISEILDRHNYYRKSITRASIPNLVWSPTVATSAQNWADYLGSNSKFEHSTGYRYGENLAKGYSSWTAAIDGWGSEKSDFVYGPFGNGLSKTGKWQNVGHYTQMIWKTTISCGCGSAQDPQGDVIYVCQYDPPGNVMGNYPY
jgi:hypothetical protein